MADQRDLDAVGVPPATSEVRGMGCQDGDENVRGFRRACADGKVWPALSALLRSAMAEERMISDPACNAKLSQG